MDYENDLRTTTIALIQGGKGLLSWEPELSLPSGDEARAMVPDWLLTAPRLNEYLSGVIFPEQIYNSAPDLPRHAKRGGLVAGITLDRGTTPLPNGDGAPVSEGLDGLAWRLDGYKRRGARFARWRAQFRIGEHPPPWLALNANAEVMARCAALCQSQGIVPLLQPELLREGGYDIGLATASYQAILGELFNALRRYQVQLHYMILGPSMITAGNDNPVPANETQIAEQTLWALRQTVPAAVPSVSFTAGTQAPEEAASSLSVINAVFPNEPWRLSFLFGYALYAPAVEAWRNDPDNIAAAQHKLLKRARLAAAASRGVYTRAMEQAA